MWKIAGTLVLGIVLLGISNPIAMASNLEAMISNLEAMASNLLTMASNEIGAGLGSRLSGQQ